eukprot:CAMPEP_0196657260 /NCGR_PEP_ID=MMETSP1086-20130531/22540_1 /TAXON_ID=77921 /ORGANISM="Cyanoptyche  gloeocystis , Strain SAG4.97" /LENGTH=297 /DNA_ID=CAMNT_0041990319 /DNA_START=38 /DNA_END=931 /DNA_ORIENTATION=+
MIRHFASRTVLNAAHAQALRTIIPTSRNTTTLKVLSFGNLNHRAHIHANYPVRLAHSINPDVEVHLKHKPQPSPYIVDDYAKVDLDAKVKPENPSDWVAKGLVKFLRIFADTFFRGRYGHRAVVLETVAGVPGMVGGMVNHLRSLRKLKHDDGHIQALLSEAENERMHLMVYMEIAKPSIIERGLVTFVQGLFFNIYIFCYTFFPKTCHRFVGYLEEEAVISYTSYLAEIDSGKIPNIPAPKVAIDYWQLKPDARLRDVIEATRADEANHRDVNHFIADEILAKRAGKKTAASGVIS